MATSVILAAGEVGVTGKRPKMELSDSDDEVHKCGCKKARKCKCDYPMKKSYEFERIREHPPIVVGGVHSLNLEEATDEERDEFISSCKESLITHNNNQNQNQPEDKFEFVKLVGAMLQVVSGRNFYLTFEAASPNMGTRTFESLVWSQLNGELQVLLVEMGENLTAWKQVHCEYLLIILLGLSAGSMVIVESLEAPLTNSNVYTVSLAEFIVHYGCGIM